MCMYWLGVISHAPEKEKLGFLFRREKLDKWNKLRSNFISGMFAEWTSKKNFFSVTQIFIFIFFLT